ncbi:MAG: ATP-binding cassette domain-containing protein [Bacteroidales bacterium]|jgi:ABC-2 type transport system ATP-binding protein|nr:ATP-binding cassette domain-containing protein [Bacteroidales bacterium]
MSVVVDNVTRLFGTQKALDNVSFSIKPGAITGFLGPNGAGKSTMMRIITGCIPSTSGRVLIDDTEVGPDNPELRKKIGYLPENNPLYPDMYVTEYLLFVASLYMSRGERKRAVEKIMNVTGLQAERGKKIGELSKGYRQRIGLAQALIHGPRVLILDEATTGLDPNQIVAIRNLISEAGKSKTVMISTHIMQEVEAICDHVIIIDKGRIVADGTREDILRLKNHSSGDVVVEFDGRPAPESLMAIAGVKSVIMQRDREYLIEAPEETDIRPALFAWAVANSLTVLSLHRKESNLEEVFRYITS